MKNLITLLFITSTAYIFNDPVIAQNPIIRDQFTADPSARVFNGRVYLYPSHDILSEEGKGRPGWFCMEYYHVFSSENLTDWTDHGVIVSQNLVKWVDTASYSMWAPDCIFRNGKYYFYFPANNKDTILNGRKTGVKARYGKFADDLIKAYPIGSATVPKTARDLARDAAFGWQTWIWARLQSQTGKSKVFYYYFDQHPEYPEDSPRFGYGSPHGQDVAYVFMHLDPSNPQTAKSDLEISEAMGTYWTNFAKYGQPNGEGVPEWPAFSDTNPVVMYLGPTPHTGPVPSEESLKVLDSYFEWRRTPEGATWAK